LIVQFFALNFVTTRSLFALVLIEARGPYDALTSASILPAPRLTP
jgi:hypothetical protein